MIFVTVGTNKRPFNRLIRAVDKIAKVNEKYDFVIQRGYSNYSLQYCRYFDFCKGEEFLAYIDAADLIISQAGFSSIGHCIRHNKPIILVPREYKYGEAVDKQYELAEHLAEKPEGFKVPDYLQKAIKWVIEGE